MFYGPIVRRDYAANRTARSAQSTAREAQSDVGAVKFDIERLLMITEALWLMLKEQHGYEDAELAKRIEEIDLRDGRLDGRVEKSKPPECPDCKRISTKNRPVCLYCGTPIQGDTFSR